MVRVEVGGPGHPGDWKGGEPCDTLASLLEALSVGRNVRNQYGHINIKIKPELYFISPLIALFPPPAMLSTNVNVDSWSM